MKPTLLAAGLLATTALPGLAATAVGLTGDRTLVMIDPATAMATGTLEVRIEGRLLGIDWRAPNQTLIGVTDGFAVVVIDPATGAVTPLVQMDTPLPLSPETPVIVDVNPAADALRFMSGTVNHRVNLSSGAVMVDGALNWAADAGQTGTPMVAGTGYINNLPGTRPESTAMYNIDAGLSALLRQAPPNDGTNRPVGMLGQQLAGPVAFDVWTGADGANTAWLAAGGLLHTVDLATGAVTGSWPLQGVEAPLRDLTFMP